VPDPLWIYACLGVIVFATTLVFVALPFIIHQTVRMDITALAEPHALDHPEDEAVFDRCDHDLAPVGFDPAGRIELKLVADVPAAAALYVNATERTLAMAVVMRPENLPAKRYVEFSTDLTDGRQFNTANSDELDTPVVLPTKRSLRTPWITDPQELWRLHRGWLRRDAGGNTRRPVPLGLTPEALLEGEFRRDFTAHVQRGTWRPDDDRVDVFRPSLRSAFLMTWAELPPFKQVRVARKRRHDRALADQLLRP